MGNRGRNKNKRLKRHRQKLKQNTVNHPSSVPPIKKENKLFKYLKKWYTIAGIIFTVFGWIAFKETIVSWFRTDQENYENSAFIKGIILPDDINANSFKVTFGTNTIALDYSSWKFRDGWPLSRDLITDCTENPIIILSVKENKLYLSTKIYDFDTNELIGEVNQNSWRIYKTNMLDFHSTDSSLRIIDKRGNNVFYVFMRNDNQLIIRGYFPGLNTVRVLSEDFDECIYRKDPYFNEKMNGAMQIINRTFE